MCSHMLHQCSAELQQVAVRSHPGGRRSSRGLPRPAAAANTGGSLRVIGLPLPGHTPSPVVPPVQTPVTPVKQPRELTAPKVRAYTRRQNEAAGLLVFVYVQRDGAAAATLAAPIGPVTHKRSPNRAAFLLVRKPQGEPMIAVMHPGATPEDIEHVVEVLRLHNLKAQISQGEERTVIGVIGIGFPDDLLETLEVLPASTASRASPGRTSSPAATSNPRTPSSKRWRTARRRARFVVIAGPCSVESREQLRAHRRPAGGRGRELAARRRLQAAHLAVRFQGLGEDGLKLLEEGREQTGLPIVTEVMEPAPGRARRASRPTCCRSAPATCRTSRCSRRSAAPGKPVHAQARAVGHDRGVADGGRVHPHAGNPNVILCERGIRTFETPRATRSTSAPSRSSSGSATCRSSSTRATAPAIATWCSRWRWPPRPRAPTV